MNSRISNRIIAIGAMAAVIVIGVAVATRHGNPFSPESPIELPVDATPPATAAPAPAPASEASPATAVPEGTPDATASPATPATPAPAPVSGPR